MFARWLEKTRQKSEEQKRLIALSISFVITGIIFACWLFFVVQSRVETPATIATDATASPIQAFKNIIKNIVE